MMKKNSTPVILAGPPVSSIMAFCHLHFIVQHDMRNIEEDNFIKVAAILLWKQLALQVRYQSLQDRLRIKNVEKQRMGESQENLGFRLEKYTQKIHANYKWWKILHYFLATKTGVSFLPSPFLQLNLS